MKKRSFQLLLLVLMLCLTTVAMFACGDDNTNDTPGTQASTEAATEATTTPATDVTTDEAVTDATTDIATDAITDVATQAPATEAPATEEPATEEPATEEPATEAETLDPLSALINAADMPLDRNAYSIGDPNSDSDIQSQYTLITEHLELYAEKTFVVYGKIVAVEDGTDLAIALGDAGVISFSKSESVLGPIVGGTVTMNAILMANTTNTDSEDATSVTTPIFTMIDYTLVEAPEAPNGGTWKYVDVNSSLNVRNQPTTQGSTVIGSFIRSDVVEVLEIVDGWAKITYEAGEDGVAYVSDSYLKGLDEV